jgi:hypothetical protein
VILFQSVTVIVISLNKNCGPGRYIFEYSGGGVHSFHTHT